ncbi:insulin-like growth factor binding protein [Anaeramoeba flamelloides]|uniref:Insulin-like growth factor binding protein n=1 Tax=Anaeramoeba flamelloides TaxID=1746091 RepID=A0ABQ8Z7L2_9EUKA|nr:insulin-like growth factor binding protein [Anaeramoeba flamelloides]
MVNTNTTNEQVNPTIASIGEFNEKYVVAWQSKLTDEGKYTIQMQIFSSSNGAKIGTELQVHKNITDLKNPSICAIGEYNEKYVICWSQLDNDKNEVFVFCQIYSSSDYSKVGDTFQANFNSFSYDETFPKISSIGERKEKFVITWQNSANEMSPKIYAQLFDSNTGSQLGDLIQVNTCSDCDQMFPSIASIGEAKENFVLTWQRDNRDVDDNESEIFAQLFSSESGNKTGEEFSANTFFDSDQINPKVCSLNNGNYFIIAWQSHDQEDDGPGIYANIFNSSNGLKVGGDIEFHINTETSDEQATPSITALAQNGDDQQFVITWISKEQDGSGYGIYAQKFNFNTASLETRKIGEEYPVNNYTNLDQINPEITSIGEGDENFVITWQSNEQDGSSYGIFMQMYNGSSLTECICEKGSYKGFENECILCPEGKYQDETNQDYCKECPIGTHNPINGSETINDCLVCDIGTYNDEVAQKECKKCPMGTYNVNTGSKSKNNCSVCIKGTYNDRWGQSVCKNCTKGTYSNEINSTSCSGCQKGTYQDEIHQAFCKECPAGTFNSNTNSESENDCTNCNIGSHQPLKGQSSCELCQEGTYQNQTGQTNCPNCRAGSYSPNTNMTSCVECSKGSYGDTEGETSFDTACKKCPLGTWSDQTGLTDESECTNCTKGFYNAKFGSTTIESCYPCPAGTYGQTEGLKGIHECKTCESNKFSNQINSTSCSLCSIGYQPSDKQDQCEPCGKGYYKNNTLDSSCTPCQNDYFNNIEGATYCLKCGLPDICLEGGKCADGRDPDTFCSDCMDNYYLRNNQCKKCGPSWIWIIYFLIIVLLIILLYIFRNKIGNLLLLKKNPIFEIYLTFLQLLATILTMSINWPEYINSNIISSTSIFNFEISTIVTPECYKNFDFYSKYLIMVLFPICFILLALLILLIIKIINLVFSFLVKKGKIKIKNQNPNINNIKKKSQSSSSSSSNENEIKKESPSSSSSSSSSIETETKNKMPVTKKTTTKNTKDTITNNQLIDTNKFIIPICNLISIMLRYLFIPEIIICAKPFQTTYQKGIDKNTLNYAPNISTDDQKYQKYYPLFLFFLYFYSISIPLFFIIILIISKKHNFSKYWKKRFGWLWEFYKPNRYWWEIPKIFFKLFIIILPILISLQHKNTLLISILSLITLMTIIIIIFKPYPFLIPIDGESRNVKSIWEKIAPEDFITIGLNLILIAIVTSGIDELDNMLYLIFYPIGIIITFIGTRKNIKEMWYKKKQIQKFKNSKQEKTQNNIHLNKNKINLSTTSSSNNSDNTDLELNIMPNNDKNNLDDENNNLLQKELQKLKNENEKLKNNAIKLKNNLIEKDKIISKLKNSKN